MSDIVTDPDGFLDQYGPAFIEDSLLAGRVNAETMVLLQQESVEHL